jgi:hypothetical protein
VLRWMWRRPGRSTSRGRARRTAPTAAGTTSSRTGARSSPVRALRACATGVTVGPRCGVRSGRARGAGPPPGRGRSHRAPALGPQVAAVGAGVPASSSARPSTSCPRLACLPSGWG